MKNYVLLALTTVNSPVIIAQMLTSGKDRKTQIFEYITAMSKSSAAVQ